LFQRKSREYMAMPVQKPRARSDDLVIEEVDNELLVYDSTNKRAHCLAATAARVWRACDGYSDASAISEALELDAEVVSQALDELDALELLDTHGLNVVQAGSGNGDGLTRRQLAKRSASVGAGVAAAPLVYSLAVPSPAAAATPTNLACALFSTNSCGVSSGAGAVAGCCCCCQSGGDCKIGGATNTCAVSSCPGGTPMCSSSCSGAHCSEAVNESGCCGVTGADGCGCAFAGGTANQDGCLCNDTTGQCNDNPRTGCAAGCTPGAVNCGAGCCSKTGCTQVAAPGGGFFLINCPGCTPGATDCVPCCNGSPISQTASGPEGAPTFNCCVPGPTSGTPGNCPRQVFGV
jgi:hypothetical protein